MSRHDARPDVRDHRAATDASEAQEPLEPAVAAAAQVDPRLLTGTRRHACFITFEGIEGSGKSTQIARLAEQLDDAGEPAVVTREPGGSPLGRRLRSLLLGGEIARIEPIAEMLLYVADRAQHLREFVEPTLASGTHVLCDRYLDATLAYQGHARGLDLELIRRLHELGLERARRRNEERRIEASEGRYEREALVFHRRVREGYLSLAEAEPFRFRIVAAEGSIDEIAARVADLLSDLFPALDGEDGS
jgi:dTMP kinase